METANHAINCLYQEFAYRCRRLRANDEEMGSLSRAYFRYRELLNQRQGDCDRLLKIFGVMGVHAPDVPPEVRHLIFRKPATSSEIRKQLKQWEILELFLSAIDDEASLSDFRGFLIDLGWGTTVPSPQALDSAIRAHPKSFEVRTEGREKFVKLRTAPDR
jgi:hypothetical protein